MSFRSFGGRGRGYGGFVLGSDTLSSMKPQAAPPEPLPEKTFNPKKPKYDNPLAIAPPVNTTSRGYGAVTLGRRRARNEEDYFDIDEEDHQSNEADLEYQPKPGSPSYHGYPDEPERRPTTPDSEKAKSESDDEDPLDAFMAGIEEQVEKQKEVDEARLMTGDGKQQKGVRDDLEEEDEQESYFRYMEENPTAGLHGDDDDIHVEYDADGNAILPDKKTIDPLPPIDHSEIDYPPFERNFYEEHDEIRQLSSKEVEELRRKLGIRVSGINVPKPVSSFAHFGFDDQLLKQIRKCEYTQPTPIQAQGIPVAVSGRDIIGIAMTGSGKTAAFIWPLLVHIMDQPELKPGDGPIGLILAPTRELAQQIYHEAKKFGKVYNIKVVCSYGGGSMWEQCKACEEGAEIIVATPGRLIDLVKKKATNLRRVTYLVYDEADRMFAMGFEPQVRSIANHVRPKRQTLLFSATFKHRVEKLARDILLDPVRVIQGELGEANQDITQVAEYFTQGPQKWVWLTRNMVKFTTLGSVLIFVTRKYNCIELAENLKKHDHKLGLIHGDMHQSERNEVINGFKKQEFPILVATDVAARGLDIPSIKTVVNYDVSRDIDTHVHRIGRTGRAGEKGTAYTLVTPKDKEFCAHLVRNLEAANQFVPPAVMELAQQNPWFQNSRWKQGKAKRLNTGGGGLGQRERPGLGSGSATSSSDSTYYGGGRASGGAGPQSERISTMKEAFASQFKNNFVSSEGTNWKPGTAHITGEEPPPPSKRKKKSRWD